MIRRFANGDIATSGRQFVEGAEGTGQAVFHRLRTFLGEYFLDITRGTPWFQGILGKAPQGVAEIAIKQQIITTPGVAALKQFSFEPDLTNRRIVVACTIIDLSGLEQDVTLEELI